jgi:flagellar basal body-associated protein FliL
MTFFDLEKECKRRQKRLLIIYIVLTFFVLLILIAIYIFVFKSKSEVKLKSLSAKKTKTVSNVKHNKHLTGETKQEKVKIEKNNIKISRDNNSIPKNKVFILKPILEIDVNDEKNSSISNTFSPKKEIKKIKKDSNSKSIIDTSVLPSFKTCILLAENYYRRGDYENALKWAKNANLQNKKDFKSWVIVAKSLYKLGKKEKAIQVLEVYYHYTKDKKILKLIDRIKNDNL